MASLAFLQIIFSTCDTLGCRILFIVHWIKNFACVLSSWANDSIAEGDKELDCISEEAEFLLSEFRQFSKVSKNLEINIYS